MSWNIQFGEGTDAITNYDRTTSWIASNNPDVVDLCEVPADNVPLLVTLLTQKTGRAWFSQFVPKYIGTDEGNLILSWHPFTSVNGKFLSVNRSVAQATINLSGRDVNIFATHLDDGSSSNRVIEVGELKSWASSFSEPRIVTGDFNAGPDTAEALSMTESYVDSWMASMNLGTAAAYPDNPVGAQTRTRRGRIDYVFASPSSTLAVTAARIPDSRDLNNPNVVITLGTSDDKGVRPSDHNFVIADFDLTVDAGTPSPTPTPPTPTPTPTPPPIPTPTPTLTTPPILLTDGLSDRALALHSPLLTRDPFPLTSPLNPGTDKRTRIMLFCANLSLLPGEPISVVTARAVSSSGVIYNLPVEDVETVPDFSWLTSIIVRLPDDPSLQGNLSVAVALRGIGSNSETIAVVPQ